MWPKGPSGWIGAYNSVLTQRLSSSCCSSFKSARALVSLSWLEMAKGRHKWRWKSPLLASLVQRGGLGSSHSWALSFWKGAISSLHKIAFGSGLCLAGMGINGYPGRLVGRGVACGLPLPSVSYRAKVLILGSGLPRCRVNFQLYIANIFNTSGRG